MLFKMRFKVGTLIAVIFVTSLVTRRSHELSKMIEKLTH